MTLSGTARLPAPLAPLHAEEETGCSLAAHLLGQDGARRGLRGGAPMLRGARAAYLTAQWRGDDDRRPAAGLLRRLDV